MNHRSTMNAQQWPQKHLNFDDSSTEDSDIENRERHTLPTQFQQKKRNPATPFKAQKADASIFSKGGLTLPAEPTFKFFNPTLEAKVDDSSKCLNFSSSSAETSTTTSPEKMRSSAMIAGKRKSALQAKERVSACFRKRPTDKRKEGKVHLSSTGTATPSHSRDDGSSNGSPPLSPSMQAMGLNCITNTPATPRTITNKLQSYVEAQSALITRQSIESVGQLTPEFKRRAARSECAASSDHIKRFTGLRSSTRKTLFGKSPGKSTPKTSSLIQGSNIQISSSFPTGKSRNQNIPERLNLVPHFSNADIEEQFFTPRETPIQFDLLDRMDEQMDDSNDGATSSPSRGWLSISGIENEQTSQTALERTPNSSKGTPVTAMSRKSTLTHQMSKAFSAFSSSTDHSSWSTPVHALRVPKTPIPVVRKSLSIASAVLSPHTQGSMHVVGSHGSSRSHLSITPSVANNTVNVNIFSPVPPMRTEAKSGDEKLTPPPNMCETLPLAVPEIAGKQRRRSLQMDPLVLEGPQLQPPLAQTRHVSAFGLDDHVEPGYDPNNNGFPGPGGKMTTPLMLRMPGLINHGSPLSSRLDEEFVMIDVLGRGEFGDVFAAQNRLDGLYYAVKCSKRPLRGTREEMCAVREVMAHAVLGHHKHIVHYFSAWSERNRLIIQNEYCNGRSVAEYLKHLRCLGIERADKYFDTSMALELLYQVLKGLKYIHANGLVHLDLKPGNIFICYPTVQAASAAGHPKIEKLVIQHQKMQLSPDFLKVDKDIDNVPLYKIGDFGHVYKIDGTNGGRADLMKEPEEGDVRYLANELLEENYSALTKSDIFSLGISVHELWTKVEPPKNGDNWHSYRTDGLIPYSSKKLMLVKNCNDAAFLRKTIGELTKSDPRMRPAAKDFIQILRTRYSHALCRGKKRRGRFSMSPQMQSQQSARPQLRRPMPSEVKRSKTSTSFLGLNLSQSDGRLVDVAKPLGAFKFNVSAGGDSTGHSVEVSELRAEVARLKQQVADRDEQLKRREDESRQKNTKIKELQSALQKCRRRR